MMGPFDLRPGVGGALTGPQLPAPGIMPTDPEQPGLWKRFQQRLEQDPNLRMALLTTGLNMMKTPQPGQSGFDVFSNAALTGVGTLDQLRQRDISQKTEAQDRADTKEYRTKQLELGEERVGVAKEGLEQRKVSDAMSYSVALQKIAADNAKDAAARAPGSTGAERIMEKLTNALVTTRPEEFPDNDMGRNKALLYLQDIENSRNNPASATKIVLERAQYLEVFKDMDEKAALTQARDEYLSTASLFGGEQLSPEGSADELEGQTISHSSQGEGRVQSVGNGRYVVAFPGGNTRSLSAEQVRKMLENNNAQ